MKASDLLVRCLENEGVEYVFGLPGEENEDLMLSLARSSIRFVNARHEQGAAFMADVYGRLTGSAGVCLATLGPGATNLITGVADAHMDKSPVVVLTGQGNRNRLHKESHQALDIVRMFEPITKWNMQIDQASVIPEAVRKAFKLAQQEKPGATHLELPEDVAKEAIEAAPLEWNFVRRPAADYKALDGAKALLNQARRPVILAGNGAIRKLASRHLRAWSEAANLPVVSTFMGKGAVSDRDPRSLMTLGFRPDDPGMKALQEADLVITVGFDVAEHDPALWNPEGAKKIVHIDFESAEVYAKYHPSVELVADISAAIWALHCDIGDYRRGADWFAGYRRAAVESLDAQPLIDEKTGLFTVGGILPLLRQVMDDEDVLISDVGSHKMWIARNYPTYAPNTCIISNGLASMGIALPGAIGAKLVRPEQKVVAAMGDGGFLMNAAELETAKRIGARFTVIVFNNNDYGLISDKQQRRSGESFGTELGNPDFVQFAQSFGIDAFQPRDEAELRRVLDTAVRADALNLIALDVV